MSRIARRDMLKAMAATSAGAALSTVGGLESVLAASPTPGNGTVLGRPRPSGAPTTPRIISTTPFTTYQSFQGSDFDAGGSGQTWSVSGGVKFPTNGGFYPRRLNLPQGSVITECIFWLLTPTTNITCYVLGAPVSTSALFVVGSGSTTTPSGSVQSLTLTMTPTVVDNTVNWYELDYEAGGTTDTALFGARIGWLNEPGLTLFPDPRRIVSGDATPFTAGHVYGPLDATLESNGSTPTGIPAGAKAAFCAVQSYTAGVLTLFPDLTSDPGIANYGATTTGPLNMTYMMVPLSSAGKFKIHSYITGRVYVDAWGYVV
jgi:hypothetical protein